MKESLSSVDIAVIVRELQELIGARVEKVYQIGREEIRLKLHQKSKGTIDLVIEAGRRLHITRYRREAPRVPSNFSMLLRKHLGGGRIIGIQQFEFDRIVELKVKSREGELSLVSELLPRGNILLIDARGEILHPFRRRSFSAREIKAHTRYERPPSRVNPMRMTAEEFKLICKASDKDVVRTLALDLGLGGVYAEEVCKRACIERHMRASELGDAGVKAVWDTIQEVLKPVMTGEGLRPHIVIENGERVDVLPFELCRYRDSDAEKIFFPTFNDAVDEFFTERIVESVEAAAQNERENRIARYERILKEQKEALRDFQAKEAECRRIGELIYARYSEIEEILRKMDIKKRIVEVSLPGLTLEIDTSISLFKNASIWYERAKAFKRKREGVERAIEETMTKLKQEQEQAQVWAREVAVAKGAIPEKRAVRRDKKEWYERFRWFVTSEGVLVIAGKDATTNELLVKKYMNKDDLFCHTQASGAPVVIAKCNEELSDRSLRAIAQFAVSYSSLWKYGFYEGECYFVKGEQVSKRPPSGEYIAKGSFIVRGKRRYLKAPLGLCIGIENNNNRLVAVPELEKDRLGLFVELAPDNELDKNSLANMIVEFFNAQGKGEAEMVTHDEVLSLLPPGKSRIKAKVKGKVKSA